MPEVVAPKDTPRRELSTTEKPALKPLRYMKISKEILRHGLRQRKLRAAFNKVVASL